MATKINCGVWMTLDIMLNNKRNKIWDNKDDTTYVNFNPKKRDRLKLRSKAVIMCRPSLLL